MIRHREFRNHVVAQKSNLVDLIKIWITFFRFIRSNFDSRKVRDTMMKLIYGNLFGFIVDCINDGFILHTSDELNSSISVLDIAGFGKYFQVFLLIHDYLRASKFFDCSYLHFFRMFWKSPEPIWAIMHQLLKWKNPKVLHWKAHHRRTKLVQIWRYWCTWNCFPREWFSFGWVLYTLATLCFIVFHHLLHKIINNYIQVDQPCIICVKKLSTHFFLLLLSIFVYIIFK